MRGSEGTWGIIHRTGIRRCSHGRHAAQIDTDHVALASAEPAARLCGGAQQQLEASFTLGAACWRVVWVRPVECSVAALFQTISLKEASHRAVVKLMPLFAHVAGSARPPGRSFLPPAATAATAATPASALAFSAASAARRRRHRLRAVAELGVDLGAGVCARLLPISAGPAAATAALSTAAHAPA